MSLNTGGQTNPVPEPSSLLWYSPIIQTSQALTKHRRTNQPGTRTKFSVVVFSHHPNLAGTDQTLEDKPTLYQNQVLCCEPSSLLWYSPINQTSQALTKHRRTNQPGTRTKFSVVVFSHQPNLTGTDKPEEQRHGRSQTRTNSSPSGGSSTVRGCDVCSSKEVGNNSGQREAPRPSPEGMGSPG
ncbi:hypothetical protein RRG08_039464 [Elysia crispata]|uniref:Uncharacterized protein n=1 Tax=Elysia crispata TaxID=231223 RepID=A0AAE0YK66_9GAST|nr:hypothetical protein RRG08_039464 [Elysia crispata]